MSMEDPVKAMKLEWRQNGTDKDWANFRYVVEGRACDPEWVPEHVKESFSSGDYQNNFSNSVVIRFYIKGFFFKKSRHSS